MSIKRLDIAPDGGQRDGTSQLRRALAALDPGYISVDERTAADFVRFAQEYAKALRYYGPDDRPAGDWSAFLSPLDADEIAALLAEPECARAERSAALSRPHVTLFLVFIKLLQLAQAELNTLTRRHLEFYFQRFLGMMPAGPVPDQVHLIVNLAGRAREAVVPRGSLLSAGPDSAGKDRIYATDRDLVVNRVQIAKLQSLYVDRRITGFKELRARVAPAEVGPALLGLALGEPGPGGPLPPYPDGRIVSASTLAALDAVTHITSESEGYYLSLSELRDLMRLREMTAQLRGAQLAEQWSKVNGLLELAGQRKRRYPGYRLPAGYDPLAFTSNADEAIGRVSVPGKGALGIEAYFSALRELEAYFFMSAESFHLWYLQVSGTGAPGWERADRLLTSAHESKVRDRRRRRLATVHGAHPADGLLPLIREVVGSPAATEADLIPLLGSASSIEVLGKAAQAADWERVYSILETALSNRLGQPQPEIEEWINLHPAADATRVAAPGATDAASNPPRWATFGRAAPTHAAAPPAPVIGWAISSPLLSLREGERAITLTLGLDPMSADPVQLGPLLKPSAPRPGEDPPPVPLAFEISTEKGWLPCPVVEISIGSYSALSNTPPRPVDPVGISFTLRIGKSTCAVAPLPGGLGPESGPAPVLRLLLRPVWDASRKQHVARYRELVSWSLLAVHMRVTASGLRDLKLQSDESILSSQKPFEPFGNAPAPGARLRILHPEIAQKELDGLSFHLQWMGAPANLELHYANYGLASPLRFTARVSFVEGAEVKDLDIAAPLFRRSDDTAAASWSLTPLQGAPVLPASEDRAGEEQAFGSRYIQWELNAPDFQHAAFPEVASSQALALAAAIANKAGNPAAPAIEPARYGVKPPYTPRLKSLTLDYTASQEVRLDSVVGRPASVRILHIHPFGACDAESERTPAGVPLLPRYEHGGELYIGLFGFAPPQTVSLLFQLAEGTSDPTLPPQPIEWSFLDGDRWIPLDGALRDTTRGLLNTGTVELALKPAAPGTRLRGDLYWVRAAVARNTAAVCETLAIHTQAVSATLQERGNAPDHFREPLPTGSLTRFLTPIPLIAGVSQPHPSRGGRTAESESLWATRVSERLRHRQRALSAWDFEHLVLSRFPEVYKAVCLPALPEERGTVRVVIIPDSRNLLLPDPFAPRAPALLLASIEEYLSARTPECVVVKAQNARYVPVRVRLRVRFRDCDNPGYYSQLLNEELNRFLSPWAFRDGADIVIGGRIYANSIIDFVDRREYVDYVAGVSLFCSEDGEHFVPVAGDFAEATQPGSVLVAARSHAIDVIYDAAYEEKLMTGISFMKLELDFIVGG